MVRAKRSNAGANAEAIWNAVAELSHLENMKGSDEAVRTAVAQMIAGGLFLEATIGKDKADAVLVELCRAQLGERIPTGFTRPGG
ncbi:hypothetical protein CK215_14500 [Mesorhizobium sp. WSM3864]|nr:hypothetical protein CK215_14500 [Mesorhizobium sp. WSM3864]